MSPADSTADAPRPAYRRLGDSGLKVSPACLGTMNFGPPGTAGVGCCDEAEATRLVHAFLDAGHNIVDTANGYTDGESERILGRALKGRREEVVLATKAFLPQGPGPNDRGLSRAHLTRALDASLRRLGTDHVDLYQCHQWDAETPIEETMATLDGFVRAGKVRYLGCSNFTAAQIVEAQWAAERVGGTRFVALQPPYSLLDRGIEEEILPTCERHGLGTLVYSPLGSGLLTGRYAPGTDPEPDSRFGRLFRSGLAGARNWAQNFFTERNFRIADGVAAVARELGTTPASVALAWAGRRPGVTSVIIGPRSTAQLTENLRALSLDLPPDALTALDTLSTPDHP
ncbi:aldo/keto reductase [Streptomyces hoynatensis]|uniref:Aldo/keto reductase n=1 Tax=Streptomyces hoynatensis TaxID=1141874 RepID=A0A3A9YMY2_9ACTN|nr:aldo/keto reductase [Streptomyces hoynatensis]RKN37500.1 aldo/keto reductase [Streptomyces hoynatensis]